MVFLHLRVLVFDHVPRCAYFNLVWYFLFSGHICLLEIAFIEHLLAYSVKYSKYTYSNVGGVGPLYLRRNQSPDWLKTYEASQS